MYQQENIYIAGPECFYTGGNELLNAMRRKAEAFGFGVSLPNDTPLKLDNPNLNKNGDEIFENCAKSMNQTTAILVDLETFRGTEPDGGSIFEVGMAFARGARCYAYTRDKRAMVHKYQGAQLKNGRVYDLDGRVLPYQNLPFSPCVVGSCKILEGGFDACLELLMVDIEEECKKRARVVPSDPPPATKSPLSEKPVVYLAGAGRYDGDAAGQFAAMRALCEAQGFYVLDPLDGVEALAGQGEPCEGAYQAFLLWQQHVRDCDILVADLNDFHGWEPSSDVSFEAGMAWQLGKRCFGYMRDTTVMRERIPRYGAECGHKDIYGNDVENFNYPINLMFASSMPVLEGGFEAVVQQIAQAVQI